MPISVIVPAYQEEERIGPVLRQLRPYAQEIVVVDDASTDRTADVARAEGAAVISKRQRQGYLEALRTGFHHASCEVLVTCDADGEFYAADLARVAAPVLRGEADLVLGRRQHAPRWSEAVLTWIANLRCRGDSGSGLRALSKPLALALPMSGKCTCGTSVLEAHLLGARIVEVDIELRPVSKGRSIHWFHAIQLWYVLRLLLKRRLPSFASAAQSGASVAAKHTGQS